MIAGGCLTTPFLVCNQFKMSAKYIASILVIFSFLLSEIAAPQPTDEQWRAIQMVETGGCKDPEKSVGDNGRSYGPLQIMKSYYSDAVQQNPSLASGGRTWENTRGPGSFEYSMEVGNAYMNRYATEDRLGRTPNEDDFSRIHNGGPNGFRRDSTLDYANKVRSNLNNRKKRQSNPYTEPYIGCADCGCNHGFNLSAGNLPYMLLVGMFLYHIIAV